MTITFSQLGKQGRLGNQLWQIAATIALAKKYNSSYAFPQWEYESFFNLHNCFNISNIGSTFQEPHFHFAPIPYYDSMDLSGYYQSYKYFEGYESFIKSVFEFSFSVEKNYNTASIHVRRGDYLKFSDYHTNLSDTSYYQQAMSIIGADRYMIFSDDIEWCKDKFIGPQFIFMQGNSPIEDLALMANCSHNIIANSSFSLWSAWLNKNPSKIVVAPQNWFGPKLQHNIKDLCPSNWIKI